MKKCLSAVLCLCLLFASIGVSAKGVMVTPITEFKYNNIEELSPGIYAAAGDFKGLVFFDENGKEITLKNGEELASISRSNDNIIAYYTYDFTAGFMDQDGNTIFTVPYNSDTYFFSEGVALSLTAQGAMLYDTTGKIIKTTDKLNSANFNGLPGLFEDGLTPFTQNGLIGYINKDFEIVIEPQFSEGFSFHHGYAVVATGEEEYYYIDKTGKKYNSEPYIFCFTLDPETGYGAFMKDGYMYALNMQTGETVNRFEMNLWMDFTDGIAYATRYDSDKFAIFNADGELLTDFEFDWHSIFYNGYSLNSIDNKTVVVNKSGDIVADDVPYTFIYAGSKKNTPYIISNENSLLALAVITETDELKPQFAITNDIKVVVNGENMTFNNDILNADGRVLYPFREFVEAIGGTVDWNAETKTAIGTLNGHTVAFPIGKSTYSVDGIAHSLTAKSVLYQNTTYLPIREIAEGLGYAVSWDSASRTVIIEAPKN